MPIIDVTKPLDTDIARLLPGYIREGRIAQQDIYDSAATILAGEVFPEQLEEDSATPTLAACSSYYCNNTTTTSITDFVWPSTPTIGKSITIVVNDAITTFVHSSSLNLVDSISILAKIKDVFQFIYLDPLGGTAYAWYQIGVTPSQLDVRYGSIVEYFANKLTWIRDLTIAPESKDIAGYTEVIMGKVSADESGNALTTTDTDGNTWSFDPITGGGEILHAILIGTEWLRY